MKNLVIQTILQYNMLSNGDTVTVGLSGGADSVSLVLCLNELKNELGITINAVHINHCLRGNESDSDQQFCEDLCKKLNIPLKVFKIDVKNEIKDKRVSLEQGARDIRYNCFEQVANGGKIATAHNLDDVAETMLFNITRGCGLNGLSSIPAVRGNIIRPLVNVSRQQIEKYLLDNNQRFVTDSTNLTDDYTRNKIRHNVIPVLKNINPSFLQSVKRLKENSLNVVDYFNSEIDKLNQKDISVSDLKLLHSAIISAYIYEKCKKKTGITLDSFHISKCVEVVLKGGRCQLPENFYFCVKNDKLCFEKKCNEKIIDFGFSLESDFVTPYNKYKVLVIDIKKFKNIKKVNNLFLNNAIDYDKICDNPRVRNKRPGDKIRLKNRKYNKQLRNVFNELKIPVEKRNSLVVLTTNEKIVWVEQIGVAEGFYPTKDTKRVLIIYPEVDEN